MMGSDGAGALETLLSDGWDYHDKESERLARELEAAAEQGVTSGRLISFVHLSTHTIGEHLGDWPRALGLGKRVLDGRTPAPETAKAWGWMYVAAMLACDSIAAADSELSYMKAAGEDFGAAFLGMRFMLAGALVSRKRAHEAARLYRGALDLVAQVRPSAFLDRTIAVASNNLGWELFEMPSRTTDEDALMLICAETSLAFWRKCGNWINEERALYLKARVANVTGRPESALADADKALAIIAANGARPLDTALLHLARASALAALGDRNGASQAIDDADSAAANLAAPDLKSQFDTERSNFVAAMP
jgi:tetratricopeptide (TPR) repeat protein